EGREVRHPGVLRPAAQDARGGPPPLRGPGVGVRREVLLPVEVGAHQSVRRRVLVLDRRRLRQRARQAVQPHLEQRRLPDLPPHLDTRRPPDLPPPAEGAAALPEVGEVLCLDHPVLALSPLPLTPAPPVPRGTGGRRRRRFATPPPA